MRIPLAVPTLLALVWPLVASGQSPVPPPATPGPTSSEPAAKPGSPNPGALSADMEKTLRKAGFTDLQILPNSVFVRGKDKAGNPVAMVLDPKSMTELVTLDPQSGAAAGGNGAPLTGSSTFTTVLASEKLASRLIGIDVTDGKGKVLGTIKDIAVDHGGIHAYVVRVGGLLGIGERFVAVTPAAITLTFDKTTGRGKATMEATPEAMQAAPAFKYADMDEATK